MIYNKSKYKKLLTILSTLGIFLNFSYAKDFTYETTNVNLSSFTKSSLKYTNLELPINQYNEKIQSLTDEEKAIEQAKKFAPIQIEEIVVEHIDDEMGKLMVVKVYLDFSKELEDEQYIQASSNATKAINSENILIKYL